MELCKSVSDHELIKMVIYKTDVSQIIDAFKLWCWRRLLGVPWTARSSPTYPSPLERKPESPAHIQRSPFPPPSSRGGILSLSGRSSMPGVPVSSQEEALSTGKARGTPDSCTHSQRPPDVSVHSMETCFSFTASTF